MEEFALYIEKNGGWGPFMLSICFSATITYFFFKTWRIHYEGPADKEEFKAIKKIITYRKNYEKR